MTEEQIVEAILVWSAVPGASRHHWGSEIDVYDRAAMPEGYRVKLLPEEYVPGGVFERLAAWLDENLQRFGFFRPYDQDRGGVYPEPWHISYAAVSGRRCPRLRRRVVADALRDEEILGKEWVLARLPEIWRTYVANVGYGHAGRGREAHHAARRARSLTSRYAAECRRSSRMRSSALALGTVVLPPKTGARAWTLGVLCAMVPDLDVVAFPLGISYSDMLGHRGLTHSS